MLDLLDEAMQTIVPSRQGAATAAADTRRGCRRLPTLRDRCLKLGAELPWEERGAILALLGSAERAFYLIDRIDDERRSVPRVLPAAETSRPSVLEGPSTAAAAPA